jgi:hypothetical protein
VAAQKGVERAGDAKQADEVALDVAEAIDWSGRRYTLCVAPDVLEDVERAPWGTTNTVQ